MWIFTFVAIRGLRCFEFQPKFGRCGLAERLAATHLGLLQPEVGQREFARGLQQRHIWLIRLRRPLFERVVPRTVLRCKSGHTSPRRGGAMASL